MVHHLRDRTTAAARQHGRPASVSLLGLLTALLAACAAPPTAAPPSSQTSFAQPTRSDQTPIPTRPPATYVATVLPAGTLAITPVAPAPTAAPPTAVSRPPGDASRAEPRVGFLAPDFELERLEGGGSVRLSDLRGRPVFINFWATWCGPCRVEMPEIEQVHQTFRDQGLVVLGVDVQEPAQRVQDYVRQGGYSWQFLLDKNSETMRAYRVTGLPSSFFVDRDGVIRDIIIGYTNRAVMESKVRPLLGQQ